MQFNAGERYGLVGANGSGKSTLPRILAGDETAERGHVAIPKRRGVGVLRQDHFRYEDMPILDVAMMGNHELWEAIAGEGGAARQRADEFDARALRRARGRHPGATTATRSRRAPARSSRGSASRADVHRQPLSTLSGGFKLRVLLAQVLAVVARRAAARRAHQPPRHPLHPLAREVPRPTTRAARSSSRTTTASSTTSAPTSSTSTTRPSRSTPATTPTSWRRRSPSASARKPRSRAARRRSRTTRRSSTASAPRPPRRARRRAEAQA